MSFSFYFKLVSGFYLLPHVSAMPQVSPDFKTDATSGTSNGNFGPYYFEYCTLNTTELTQTVATHIPLNSFARHAYEDCKEIIVQPVQAIQKNNNPCNTRTLETSGDQRIHWAAKGCEHPWGYWGDIENGGDPYLKMQLKEPPYAGWYGESQGVACIPALY